MNKLKLTGILLAVLISIGVAMTGARAEEKFLLMAGTIGPIDSGIVAALEEQFEKESGIRVRHVGAGTGEALKIAERLQGGGHANACGATLPRSVKTIPDALIYLRQTLNPKKEEALNSLEDIFASLDLPQK